MNKLLQRLRCWFDQHDLRVARRLGPFSEKVHCDACDKDFAVNHSTETMLPWDAEFEALYAPGGILDPKKR